VNKPLAVFGALAFWWMGEHGSGRVFAVEHPGSAKQDKPLIHNFHVMNRARVRHYRVSS
jgi:hypothetical protein